MSDQHNLYDNLRDDETRSEEGSIMGSDTAEFFVDDDAPVRVLGSDGVADILAKDDSNVPQCLSVEVRSKQLLNSNMKRNSVK